MKELVWGSGFSAAVLIAFLAFVAFGWPGGENDCLEPDEHGHNSCYCEAFVEADIGKPGVRQPFNTWSNLYSLATGALLGFIIWWNRRNGLPASPNRFKSTHFYPITYLLVLIFLGLGSMWFHASIIDWAGVFDQISMFTYACFLLFYSIVRLSDRDLVFYIGYPLGVVALTIPAIAGVDSLYLIIIAVGLYLLAQGWIWLRADLREGWGPFWKFWVPAAACMLVATLFWALSQTGGPLCLDTHAFQFHGLWHLLAGAMAFLLYFFFRSAPG